MEKFFHIKFSDQKTETFGDFQASFGNKSCNVFADWIWDGNKFSLTNDRYGFYPIYYFRRENEFAVSSSITKLLEIAGNIELDEDAFSVFLRLGWLIGEDTLFSAIRAVPPASFLTWQNGELNIESKGIIESKPLKISRPEAVENYAQLFQKSVEKTLPNDGNFFVPLSGGRDSRHILFSILRANRKPLACLTIIHPPPRPNEDVRIAKQICEKLNLKHHSFEQKKSRFENEIRKNIQSGFSVYEHGWFLALADFISENNSAVYDGIAGDVLSAGLFLTEEKQKLFEQNKFEELADKILESEGYLPKILTKEFSQRCSRERAVSHLVKEIKRHRQQPNPVGSFYFWNRTRRCIAPSPFRLLGNSANIITPYLETELFDFLASLPAEMLLDKEFHNETIAFAFPEYADFPYENKSVPAVSDNKYFRTYSRDIFRYSRTKKNRRMANGSFFLLRYLRSMIDKKYAVEYGEQAVHLLQMERL